MSQTAIIGCEGLAAVATFGQASAENVAGIVGSVSEKLHAAPTGAIIEAVLLLKPSVVSVVVSGVEAGAQAEVNVNAIDGIAGAPTGAVMTFTILMSASTFGPHSHPLLTVTTVFGLVAVTVADVANTGANHRGAPSPSPAQ